jgi:hypothetical protein
MAEPDTPCSDELEASGPPTARACIGLVFRSLLFLTT